MSIALFFDNDKQYADLKYTGRTIVAGPQYVLRTAVIMSLFTNRRPRPGEYGYDPNKWMQGCWMDGFVEDPDDVDGSLLYLLEGAKMTSQTIRLAKMFSEDCLRWMTKRKVAKRVDVETEARTDSSLAIGVTLIGPDGVTPMFSEVWDKAI